MDIINKLTIGDLEFKITSEKLYIESITGSETYALRSINGISVKDDINRYNMELNALKSAKTFQITFLLIGVSILFLFLYMGGVVFGLIFSSIFLVPAIIGMMKVKEPRLLSVVRVTMNSGDKAFEFYKSDAKADDVASFVAALEKTLTAFHKD